MTMTLDLPSRTMGDFGETLRVALRNAGKTQTWLGEEVARIEGRSDAYFQTVVSNWCVGKAEPSPMTVFAIEEALGLRGGSLSRHLGYLPLTAKDQRSPEDAIRADPTLPEQVKKAVLVFMRELRR